MSKTMILARIPNNRARHAAFFACALYVRNTHASDFIKPCSLFKLKFSRKIGNFSRFFVGVLAQAGMHRLIYCNTSPCLIECIVWFTATHRLVYCSKQGDSLHHISLYHCIISVYITASYQSISLRHISLYHCVISA